ncbi:MAG TPA: hypothetical protein VHX86_01990 [Tepidisphaeraceae bacterium]|jgi:hypothetical protein|nr:hypothetical protein [Tepidisphaeraceae bacterium]
MNPSSLATALVGAQTGMLQLAMAADITSMNQRDGSSIVKLIDSAQQNANSLVKAAAGLANLDVTA